MCGLTSCMMGVLRECSWVRKAAFMAPVGATMGQGWSMGVVGGKGF